MSLLSNLSFMKLQEVNQYRRIEPLNICSFSDWFKTESWISQDEDYGSTCTRAEASSCPKYSPGQRLEDSACMGGRFFTSQFGTLENV